jgi:hypothetical protein
MIETNTGGFGGGRFTVDIRIRLGRLMIEAKPSFLISGTASTFVAPAHATVVSRRVKLVTPGTVSLVTC